jgi:hypothetical protein
MLHNIPPFAQTIVDLWWVWFVLGTAGCFLFMKTKSEDVTRTLQEGRRLTTKITIYSTPMLAYIFWWMSIVVAVFKLAQVLVP